MALLCRHQSFRFFHFLNIASFFFFKNTCSDNLLMISFEQFSLEPRAPGQILCGQSHETTDYFWCSEFWFTS